MAVVRRLSERTARAAARRGAKLLDKKFPRWVELVDVDALSLGSSCKCVLGQLFEPRPGRLEYGFDVGLETLELATEDAIRLGFISRHSDPEDDYRLLDLAWRDEVRARQ